MGLDTTHNCWHGPYSHFNNFRRWVAKQIGLNLDSMEGFGGDISFDITNHPIKPLLEHSDCDGELTPDECRSIIEGAEIILNKIDPAEWKDWEVKLKAFANGCKKAIENNENVKFR